MTPTPIPDLPAVFLSKLATDDGTGARVDHSYGMRQLGWLVFFIGDLRDGTYATAWFMCKVANTASLEAINNCNHKVRFSRAVQLDDGTVEAWMDIIRKRGMTELLCFSEIAGVQRTLNRPLTEYFLKISRNVYAHVPAIAATTLATSPFEISVVCQWDGTHKWHPLLNIRPQYVLGK